MAPYKTGSIVERDLERMRRQFYEFYRMAGVRAMGRVRRQRRAQERTASARAMSQLKP